MKNTLQLLLALVMLPLLSLAQKNVSITKTYTKTVDGRSVLVKEGTLSPQKIQESQSPVISGSTNDESEFAKPVQIHEFSAPWSEMTIQEQVNTLTQEIERLKAETTDPHPIKKLEVLLEQKKLENSFQTKL